MIDSKKLSKDLSDVQDGIIALLEINANESFEANLASISYLIKNNDVGIILSASRPYSNIINLYSKNKIDVNKLFFLDLVSKSHHAEVKADNVTYLENVSALTDISLALSEAIKNFKGKKFVFIDSITTMLIHNEPYVFARFIHSILTRMRLNGVGGVLISLTDSSNYDLRAEIAQICDKVIKIE